ncbi:hypothetical protein C7T35_27255 [Variovorax sp. WS11]|uniref:hypothetical protein n=1 Tax=Variovorax sp. WS11 TaxID=1105204 RepID=UPI000D0E089B|nr:hypothetical protein [Variovorax sp. WS11]NDZ16016.1 hypothetical protein [Variovorax sp. WS11]PSL81460.1 hypothetical protein C7T35_27255 [Variovorax sp. WS11]
MTSQDCEKMRKKWADDLKAAGKTALSGKLLDIDGALSALWSTYQGSKLGLSILLEMIDRWHGEHAGAGASDKTWLAVTALERWAAGVYHQSSATVNARGSDFGQKVIAQRAVVLKSGQLPLKISYEIKQEQQWPSQALKTYKWSTYLEVAEHGPVVLVRVFAAYDPGGAKSQSIKQSMKNVIESFWNVAKVDLGDGRRARDLQFDLTWVDPSTTYRELIVPKTTPIGPPPKPLNLMNPAELKAWRDQVSEVRGVGANLGTWDVEDRVEVIHEFGHMIGNPDEYFIKSFENVPSPYRADIYDKPGFTTDSIMNNTDNYDKNSNKSYGKIHLRHFDTVKRAIAEYLKCTGRAANTVTITL